MGFFCSKCVKFVLFSILEDYRWANVVALSWVNEVVAAHGSFMDLVDLCVTKPGMGELFKTTSWFLWNHQNKVRLNERTLSLSRAGEVAKNLVWQVQQVKDGGRLGLGG